MERERVLAAHNLHACHAELQTIKQAILDGRLWELVEARSRVHPTLQTAFERMLQYSDRFEVETPVRKRKGPFVLTEQSLRRPEVVRHQTRLLERYAPPSNVKTLLLLPEALIRPFRERSGSSDSITKLEQLSKVHLCSYGLTYAVVPHELLDVYPLSQTETSLAPTPAAIRSASKRIAEYVKKFGYTRCIVVGSEDWHSQNATRLKQKLKRGTKVTFLEEKELDKSAVRRILKALK